jgi:hypothetical protein
MARGSSVCRFEATCVFLGKAPVALAPKPPVSDHALFEPVGDPDFDDRLSGDTEPRRFAIEGIDHPVWRGFQEEIPGGSSFCWNVHAGGHSAGTRDSLLSAY